MSLLSKLKKLFGKKEPNNQLNNPSPSLTVNPYYGSMTGIVYNPSYGIPTYTLPNSSTISSGNTTNISPSYLQSFYYGGTSGNMSAPQFKAYVKSMIDRPELLVTLNELVQELNLKQDTSQLKQEFKEMFSDEKKEEV